MKFTVSRTYGFSASHRLQVPGFSEEENSKLYGKCNNPYGHGHDYLFTVSAAGALDGKTGTVLKRGDLDALVEAVVLPVFRHKNLNVEVPQFRVLVPTTENVAMVIKDLLLEHWSEYITRGTAQLARVHVQETDRNSFEIVLPVSELRTEQKEINEDAIVHA